MRGQLLDVSQSFGTSTDGGDICVRQPRLPFQLPKCFHTRCSCLSMPPPFFIFFCSFADPFLSVDALSEQIYLKWAKADFKLLFSHRLQFVLGHVIVVVIVIAPLGMEPLFFFLPPRIGPASHLVCVLSCLACGCDQGLLFVGTKRKQQERLPWSDGERQRRRVPPFCVHQLASARGDARARRFEVKLCAREPPSDSRARIKFGGWKNRLG